MKAAPPLARGWLQPVQLCKYLQHQTSPHMGCPSPALAWDLSLMSIRSLTQLSSASGLPASATAARSAATRLTMSCIQYASPSTGIHCRRVHQPSVGEISYYTTMLTRLAYTKLCFAHATISHHFSATSEARPWQVCRHRVAHKGSIIRNAYRYSRYKTISLLHNHNTRNVKPVNLFAALWVAGRATVLVNTAWQASYALLVMQAHKRATALRPL
mgnify:CR=1 FL=1